MQNQLQKERDSDSFDVKGSVAAIARATQNNKLLVVLTCLFTVALVSAYIAFWPPVYTGTAVIMVERDTDPVRDAFYTGWDTFRKDDSRTEVELITSTPVLQEVVERENLTYDEVYHPFAAHLSYLWEKSWLGRKYHEIRDQLSPKRGPQLTEKQKDFIRTVVSLKQGVSVEVVPETNAGRIDVKGPTDRVAAVANRIIDVYMAQRARRFQSEAQRSVDILTREVQLAQDHMSEIEEKRMRYTNRNNLTFDFQQDTLEVNKLTDLETEINTSRVKIASAEADLKMVEIEMAAEPRSQTTIVSTQLNTIRENLKLRRSELASKLLQISDRYRADSPEVLEAKNELAKIDQMITEEPEQIKQGSTEGLNSIREELASKRDSIRANLEGERAGLSVLLNTKSEMEERLGQVPKMRLTLRQMDRDIALTQEKYQQLIAKQAQASVSLVTAKAAMPSMRVVEYGMPPTEPMWPKTRVLLPCGILAGLIFGLFGAVLRDYVSDRIRRDHIAQNPKTLDLFSTVMIGTDAPPFSVLRIEKTPPKLDSAKAQGA